MSTDIVAPCDGTIVGWTVAVGDDVRVGATLGHVDLMKMEHAIVAVCDGTVATLAAVGATVTRGKTIGSVSPAAPGTTTVDDSSADEGSDTGPRSDVAAVADRHALLDDDARPDAVAKRHDRGFRTARENLADLVDEGTFVEHGGLAIAAQRNRRGVDTLIADTPADGLITGIGDVRGEPTAIALYDATVLAGTQGAVNHRKLDRLLRIATQQRLPLVLFAEGGGGRPGDTDIVGGAFLDVTTFRMMAKLGRTVPTIAVVNGYCFAGNAALAGVADVIIATERSWLGMAGPAMIAGGGLGEVAATDIGPVDVQRANGVIDVVVDDERAGARVARDLVALLRGDAVNMQVPAADQRPLRDLVPTNRRRPYAMRTAVATIADRGSLIELRRDAAAGMITALARVNGAPVAILANDPDHLGGAIDADAADSAVQHLELAARRRLPLIVFCDTPGFMVGPEAERDGGVRRFGRMFMAAADLDAGIVAVITRKAYGLGAMAMLGGDTAVPILTLGWPTSELGPMGLEGAVRLGFRRELEAIDDPAERAELQDAMIAFAHDHASGLNIATFGEVDDVVDPAKTRELISRALRWAAPPRTP